MSLPTFDPHPYGCPLSLGCTPSEMPDRVLQIVLRLRDLLFPTVHVVNPSRGASYPLLNLHARADDDHPRVVLFPGWEDDRASVRRRLDYGRQFTLLQRIQEAGVRGEQLEQWRGEPLDGGSDEPVLLPVAVTALQMTGVIHDLQAYLGDLLRVRVLPLPRASGADLQVVRLYAPTDEALPRLMLYPAWASAAETPRGRVSHEQIAARLASEPTQEVSASELLGLSG